MFKKMVIVGFFGIIVLVNRDKLGTTFFDNWPRSAESALFIGFDKAGENQAERAGFEPAVRCYSYADLANRCFRPLSHLSVRGSLAWRAVPIKPCVVGPNGIWAFLAGILQPGRCG